MKIGVGLPIAETDEGSVHHYREIRDIALSVEAAGLDSIWIFDHLLYRWPDQPTRGVWEAWTFLTALAEATTKIELGTIVLCTAFRNPALLAKMTDALQEVSDGRFTLGVGAGWHQPEFDAFGLPFDHLASRFEEAMEIIAPLVRTGAVDFSGTYEQAPNCESTPRGPAPAKILIAGGKPRMLRLTAKFADAYNTAWIGWPEEVLPERIARLHAACDEVGRDPQEIELNIGVNVAFPDLGFEDERLGDKTAFITGTSEEIAAAFRAHEALGVGHLIVLPQPFRQPAFDRLAEAVAVYKQG